MNENVLSYIDGKCSVFPYEIAKLLWLISKCFAKGSALSPSCQLRTYNEFMKNKPVPKRVAMKKKRHHYFKISYSIYPEESIYYFLTSIQ